MIALLDKVFLVGSYSLLELELYCSVISWLLGFVLRGYSFVFTFVYELAFFS
jgi:hypothetical protein